MHKLVKYRCLHGKTEKRGNLPVIQDEVAFFSMKRYKTPEQGSYRRRKPRNDPDRMNKFTARKFAFVATFLGSACGTLLVANPLYSSHFAGE